MSAFDGFGPDPDDFEPGIECHECEGTGEIVDDHDLERTCPECGGSGFANPTDPDPEWSV